MKQIAHRIRLKIKGFLSLFVIAAGFVFIFSSMLIEQAKAAPGPVPETSCTDDGCTGTGVYGALNATYNELNAAALNVKGDVDVTGNQTAGCLETIDFSFQQGDCSSDQKFKRNIIPLAHVLDKVVRLKPVRFKWRVDKFPRRHFSKGTSVGLIAQDVEKVMPELVGWDKEGYRTVRYGTELDMLAIQAIKELKEENQAAFQSQQKKLAKIEEQIQDIKTQLKSP